MSSRSFAILAAAKKKDAHDGRQKRSDLKQLHRPDAIVNGHRVGLGCRIDQIQFPFAVKKKPASIGYKRTISIRGKKESMSCTSKQYDINTKAIKDVACF